MQSVFRVMAKKVGRKKYKNAWIMWLDSWSWSSQFSLITWYSMWRVSGKKSTDRRKQTNIWLINNPSCQQMGWIPSRRKRKTRLQPQLWLWSNCRPKEWHQTQAGSQWVPQTQVSWGPGQTMPAATILPLHVHVKQPGSASSHFRGQPGQTGGQCHRGGEKGH